MFATYGHDWQGSDAAFLQTPAIAGFVLAFLVGFVDISTSKSAIQMIPEPKFVRRIGPDPHAGGLRTPALNNCPDIWELESGDFAVIGINITDQAASRLPPSAGCGPDEQIVFIPRRILVDAKRDIPDK